MVPLICTLFATPSTSIPEILLAAFCWPPSPWNGSGDFSGIFTPLPFSPIARWYANGPAAASADVARTALVSSNVKLQSSVALALDLRMRLSFRLGGAEAGLLGDLMMLAPTHTLNRSRR